MSNPHLYLLTKTLRTRSIMNSTATQFAVRGGGHFHRPDPKLPKPYHYSRRFRLEDINTVLYHDFAPEYHLHLHSPWIQNSKQGCALIFIYSLLVIFPVMYLAYKLQRWSTCQLYPAVRPGPDHAHMAPRLLEHLRQNNYENKPDFLGRNNAQFYRNFLRQDMSYEMKPYLIRQLNKHGFKF